MKELERARSEGEKCSAMSAMQCNDALFFPSLSFLPFFLFLLAAIFYFFVFSSSFFISNLPPSHFKYISFPVCVCAFVVSSFDNSLYFSHESIPLSKFFCDLIAFSHINFPNFRLPTNMCVAVCLDMAADILSGILYSFVSSSSPHFLLFAFSNSRYELSTRQSPAFLFLFLPFLVNRCPSSFSLSTFHSLPFLSPPYYSAFIGL